MSASTGNFLRQFASHFGADLGDVDAAHDAVRPRKINVLEHAKGLVFGREWPFGPDSVFANDDDFARFHLANEFRVDEIERARFGGEDVSAVQFAEHQRPEAERVAHPDDFAFAHYDKTERALQPPEHAQRAPAIFRRLGEQVRNDFAVGCRLENGAFAFQLIAQDGGIDQIAIVRHRDLAAKTIDHERLRVFQRARAGGGITRMADRARAFQSLQLLRAEHLRDQAHVAMKLKGGAGPFARHDPGAFLPAMLEREEAVVSQHRGVRMAEDREDPALVLRIRVRFWRCGVPRRNQEASCPYNPSSERRFNHSFERGIGIIAIEFPFGFIHDPK